MRREDPEVVGENAQSGEDDGRDVGYAPFEDVLLSVRKANSLGSHDS